MSYLLLVRHGESEYNAKKLFTGTSDAPLTAAGREEITQLATQITDLKPDLAYTSRLSRAQDTLAILLHENNWDNVPVRAVTEFNERDYGDLTGLNKSDVKKTFGATTFDKLRRGWDEPIPGGETLKMVSERVVPYFLQHILPKLQSGRSVLIVTHNHSLRTLIKYLDNLSDQQVEQLRMYRNEVVTYKYSAHGTVESKQIRKLL
jgi:2,3-bisphosphoglycerate-dependent phosphoglycerate mutase